jgi:ferric-dicitrate binding protein FerR (iron transport regulator)
MSDLTELIGKAIQGEATPEERARLTELLLKDADARRAWREHVNVHVGLKNYCAMPGTVADSLPEAPRRRRWPVVAAAAVLLAAAGLLAVRTMPGAPLGRLSRVSQAAWTGRAPAVGAAVVAGRLELSAGFAEITLENGIRLVLESPVAIDLRSADRARLERGRVVAHVPPEGRGFTVETPGARLVDLGTEFGIGVRDDGQTEVQVFQGEVVAELKGAAARRLEAGTALRIEAGTSKGSTDIPFEPERFVRMFPTEGADLQPAGPVYNRSRFDALHVVPAPGAVDVDGDLAEWDRSGAIYSACWPPYHESHTFEAMLMYDARFLYVAARVGDPAPMRSVMDPAADPGQYAWRGGSVILRLATMPDVGARFEARARALADSKNPEYGTRPVDVDERITHLTFWHHRPTGAARLHAAYGMDFHGEKVDPPGWSGAFRMHPNGLGYTLEYAIPWALLHAGARPPRAGDRLPSSWTVHWSDQEGRHSRGHLVEGVNLDELPYRFLKGSTWGRAVFHERGRLSPGTVVPRAK